MEKVSNKRTWEKISFQRKFRYVLLRLLRLKGHPHELALGTAFGIFVGMLPIIPFHMIVAVTLAFAFKASKITAASGTWICNPLTIYHIYKYCFKLGAYIIGFDHNTNFLLPVYEAANSGKHLEMVTAILGNSGIVIASFLLGGIILGIVLALPSYFIFLNLFKAYISWRKSKKMNSA